jgi:hypothetical protein
MPDSAVAPDVHQSLDVHLGLASERTFNLVLGCDDRTDALHLVVIQVANFLAGIHSRLRQNGKRRCPTDPGDVGQADFRAFLFGQINSRNTSHACAPPLALTLFVLWIGADDPHHPFAPDDFAIPANLLD